MFGCRPRLGTVEGFRLSGAGAGLFGNRVRSQQHTRRYVREGVHRGFRRLLQRTSGVLEVQFQEVVHDSFESHWKSQSPFDSLLDGQLEFQPRRSAVVPTATAKTFALIISIRQQMFRAVVVPFNIRLRARPAQSLSHMLALQFQLAGHTEIGSPGSHDSSLLNRTAKSSTSLRTPDSF